MSTLQARLKYRLSESESGMLFVIYFYQHSQCLSALMLDFLNFIKFY